MDARSVLEDETVEELPSMMVLSWHVPCPPTGGFKAAGSLGGGRKLHTPLVVPAIKKNEHKTANRQQLF